MSGLGATFKETKKSAAFEGMIITSDREFFASLGYVKGQPPPQKVIDFFDECYRFAVGQIGYKGTDENIISAVVHLDETTPHLQLYYIPLVDHSKRKVYEKDAEGKVRRNAKGSPIQAKDGNGKSVYEYVRLDKPNLCSSDFWEERGAQHSFGSLQDDFHDTVGYRYGLDRGEVGSTKKHTTKYQWEKQKQEQELAEIEQKKQAIMSEIKEYSDAVEDAKSGKRPFFKGQLEKQITGLVMRLTEMEKEKAISDKDKADLFKQLTELQKRVPELEKHRELIKLLLTYAPEEFREARRIASDRQTDKYAPKPRKNNNFKF